MHGIPHKDNLSHIYHSGYVSLDFLDILWCKQNKPRSFPAGWKYRFTRRGFNGTGRNPVNSNTPIVIHETHRKHLIGFPAWTLWSGEWSGWTHEPRPRSQTCRSGSGAEHSRRWMF